MKSITILIFVSLVSLHQVYGHKIHKRQLKSSKELPSKKLLNGTNIEAPTTPVPSARMVTEPKTLAVTQAMQNWSLIPPTEAPETLAHPFVEATEVRQSNESDFNVQDPIKTEKPQEANTNSSKPGETFQSVFNIISKPVQIVKEDCTCFSIRHPPLESSSNSVKHSQKFENATTSVLSEIESEIGVLFEIAASGVLPRANEFIGKSRNESLVKNTSQEVSSNDEDFMPFVSLQSLFGRIMPLPQETIIIQGESGELEPFKLLPEAGADLIHNGTDSIKKDQNPTTTQKNNQELDEKKPNLD